jgi:hypothetical protein
MTWLPVVGWEGWYEVCDRPPQVRSLDRVITRSDGRPYRARGRVLRPGLHRNSWVKTVTLARAGHKHQASVHKLVNAAFNHEENT